MSDTPRARKVNIEVTGSAVDESLVKEADREPARARPWRPQGEVVIGGKDIKC